MANSLMISAIQPESPDGRLRGIYGHLSFPTGIFGRQTEMEMFGAPNFHGQPTHNNDLECLQWGGRYSCKGRGFPDLI